MTKFGYGIEPDNQIDYDRADRRLALDVARHEPTFNTCISCGTCAGTCSAAQFTDFSFRRIVIHVKLGLVSLVKEEIEHCMMCGKCLLACPRGVNTRNAIFQIKKALQTLDN